MWSPSVPGSPRRAVRSASCLVVALVLAGCGGVTSGSGGSVIVSGSSTVEPISTRAAELFNDVDPSIDITVDGPGTGDGFLRFCRTEIDISNASRPIKPEEEKTCTERGVRWIELKVAFDGLSVLTHPANREVSCVSLADLYALLGPESRGVGTWSGAEPLARELGSSTVFPSSRLRITAPGTESGTYDSFVELAIAPIAKQRAAAGHLEAAGHVATRPDYTSASDDNTILTNIQGTPGALGWVGFAFAEEAGDRVRELEIDPAGDGRCVKPSVETIADGSYPLARPLYVYVNLDRAQANPALVSYLDFYLGEAYHRSVTTALGTTGYVPLPDDLLAETRRLWAQARPAGTEAL
jgi:phosphate transport system substrate-binding protein